MLKITTQTDTAHTLLELEGKLAGPWVRELEDCWRKAGNSERSVRVMLCAVTFIDDKGIALLAHMYQHGAELVAEGCMNKAIVEQIMRGDNHE
jgi:ABC-type transporter Mla MlaB component